MVLLFVVFMLCGLRISGRASDAGGRLMAFGITILITLQAAINIGVVTGRLPTKGIPLPFISFGGTSLVVTLFMVGVLLNIARQGGGRPRSSDPEGAGRERPLHRGRSDGYIPGLFSHHKESKMAKDARKYWTRWSRISGWRSSAAGKSSWPSTRCPG